MARRTPRRAGTTGRREAFRPVGHGPKIDFCAVCTVACLDWEEWLGHWGGWEDRALAAWREFGLTEEDLRLAREEPVGDEGPWTE